MKIDLTGYFCKYLYLILKIISRSINTAISVTKAYLFGIELGNKCKFSGNLRFYRKPNSSIIIGNNCKFLSKSDCNLIGINHKCIIATHKIGAKIIIGDNCGFSGSVIGAFNEISIGNNVRCGANTTITDGDWHNEDPRTGISKPVVIKDNVWLGINVIILKGVTIGRNTLIGANSVVTKDIPDNVIAAGNPCKILKHITAND